MGQDFDHFELKWGIKISSFGLKRGITSNICINFL